MMHKFITAEEVVYINKSLGYSTLNRNLIDSALSSIDYYDDIKLKISSIVRGIVKNHAFRDGNKRTATLVYLILCENNHIMFKNDRLLFDAMIEIAANNYSVEKISKLLF